jgi:hypothetical protein
MSEVSEARHAFPEKQIGQYRRNSVESELAAFGHDAPIMVVAAP